MSSLFAVFLMGVAMGQTVEPTSSTVQNADTGFNAHGFNLAAHDADVRDLLTIVRPGAMEANSWFAGGMFEYASRPLVYVDEEGENQRDVLSNVLAANMSLGFVVHERARIDVAAPLFVSYENEDGAQGVGIGDVRVSGLVSLLSPAEDDIGVGLLGSIDAPTGDYTNYIGSPGIAGGLALVATREGDAYTATASAGVRLASNTQPDARPLLTLGGDMVEFGGGVGYLIADDMGVNIEANAAVPIDPVILGAIGVHAQAMGSFRYVTESGGHVSVGVGTGLGSGFGSSPIRAVLGGGFGASGAAPDTDGDGLVDRNDKCPAEPETVNGIKDDDGCPDAKPMLTVSVESEGVLIKDVDLKATLPNGEEKTSKATLKVEGMPGDVVKLAAVKGCKAGYKNVTLGDADSSVKLKLKKSTGIVKISVVDDMGNPIPSADVRYLVKDASCAPVDRSIKNAVGEHEIGIGVHTVFVSADGYGVHREKLAVEKDKTIVVKAVLDRSVSEEPAQE